MYLSIQNRTISTIESDLSLESLQQAVDGYIELAYHQLSDPSIVLVCNEEALLNGYDPTLKTPKGLILHGTVLAVGLQESDIVELTDQQVEIVRKELVIY